MDYRNRSSDLATSNTSLRVGRFTEKQERLWTLACVSSIFACFLDIGIDCFARINADKT